MMSRIKNMNLKNVCLAVGCLLTVGMVSPIESQAGVVPWTYNALFGPSRNGPMYYGAGYGPRTYTSYYGGYGMSSGNCCGTPAYVSYGTRAQARRQSRRDYRWSLINNPQVVGVPYRSYAGGNSYGFASAAYGPGCCSPCGLGGCSTGACGAGCSSGQCGVSYNPASASTPTPDPATGSKVPQPREIRSTPPKTFADDPMLPGKSKPDVEDSGFGARRYDRKPMDTPMPKDDAVDPFKKTIKRPGLDTPGKDPSIPDFGTENKKDDLFGTEGNKTDAFKVTPDGKLPKTTIPQKKVAPTKKTVGKAPKAQQETNFPPLRVRPLNLDQKITWKSAPKAERLTIRAHFTAPRIVKQNVPVNSGWYAITDSTKIASK